MANFIFTRDSSKDTIAPKKTMYYAWPEYTLDNQINICWATKTLNPKKSSPVYYLINQDNGVYASTAWYKTATVEEDGIAKRLTPASGAYIDNATESRINIKLSGKSYNGNRDSSMDMDSTIDEVSIKVLYDDYSSLVNSITLDGNAISIPSIHTITRGVSHTIEVNANINSPSRIYYNDVMIAEESSGPIMTGTFVANAAGEIKISID
jgi:hypothetical protein